MKKPLIILSSILIAILVAGLSFRFALAALTDIVFSGTSTSDISWPAGQTLSFVQGGSERMRIDATTGDVVIPGNITVTGSITTGGGTSGWINTENGIWSNGSLYVDLDNNNNGGDNFFIRNGQDVNVLQMAEGGTLQTVSTIYPGTGSALQSTYGIWQTGAGLRTQGGFYIDGSVGIGTTSPNAKLEVRDTGAGSSATGTQTMRISTLVGAAGTVVDALYIDAYADTAYNKGVAISIGYKDATLGEYTSRIINYGNISSTRATKLQLQTHSVTQGVWNDGLLIDNIGNVGIGTTSPSDKLEVYGGGITVSDGVDQGFIDFRQDRDDLRIYESSYALYMQGVNGLGFEIDANSNDGGSFNITDRGVSKFYISDITTLVGIGTTSPIYRLQILGADTAYGSGNAIFGIKSNLDSELSMGVYETGNYAWIRAFEAGLGFRNLVLQPDGGSVGIGTTTPGAKLDIGDSTNGSAYPFRITTSDASIVANQELGADFTQNGIAIGRISSTYFNPDFGFNFYGNNSGLNSTPVLTMRGSGLVGINTASPSYTLDVNGSTRITGDLIVTGAITTGGGGSGWVNAQNGVWTNTSLYLDIDNDNNGTENFFVRNGADANIVQIDEGGTLQTVSTIYPGTGSALQSTYGIWQTGAGLRTQGSFFVDGNVGIGTASPSVKFVVSKNISSLPAGTGDVVAQLGQVDGTTNRFLMDAFANQSVVMLRRSQGTAAAPSAVTSGLILGSFGAGGYGATGYSSTVRGIISVGAAENWTDTAQGTFLTFYTTALGAVSSTERVRIDSTGQVGIGTATPAAKLNVIGHTLLNYGSAFMGTRADGGIGRLIQVSDGTWGSQSIANSTLISSIGGNSIQLNPDNGNVLGMTIDQLGNVGIGTTSLYAKFQVNVGTNQNLIMRSSGATASLDSLNDAGSAFANMRMEAAQFALMTGNVGINTTSPSYKLDVNGNTRITGDLTVTGNINLSQATYNQTSTAVSGSVYNLSSSLTGNPATASSANYYSNLSQLYTSSANNFTGYLYSGQFLAQHNGTGTASNLYSIAGYVTNNTTGTVTTAVGSYSQATNSSTGTINNAYGFYTYFSNAAGGTIGNLFGLRISASNLGTITTSYGIYIDDLPGVTQYGIYQAGGSDVNYFAGNVGIGTASPGSKLEVNGDIKTTNSNQAIVARYTTSDIYSSSLIWNTLVGGVLTLGNNGTNEIRAGKTATGGNLRFIVNNTAAETAVNNGITAMNITSSGNVGIGIASPDSKLHVAGDIHTNAAFILDSGQLLRAAGGSAGLTVDVSGNVGIGTISPTNGKLQIVSTDKGITLEKSSGSYFSALGFNGNDPYLTYYSLAGLTIGYGTTTGGAPTVNTMTLTNSGNVGIGTSSPNNKFVISDGSRASTAIAPAATGLEITRATGADAAVYFNHQDKQFIVGVDNSFPHFAISEGNDLGVNTYFAIKPTSGNVGIGTGSPGSKLDVNGRAFLRGDSYQLMIGGYTGSGDFLLLRSGNTPSTPAVGDDRMFWIQHTRTTATNFVDNIWQKGDGASGAQVNTLSLWYNNGVGRVGIGTTAPGYALDIQGGQINASGGLCIAGDCKTVWPAGVGGSGTTGYIPKFTAATTIGNSLIYDNGTKIGIGTASPSEVLSVNGAIALDGTATTAANGGMFRHTNGVTYFVGKSNGVGAALTNGDGTASLRAYSPGGSTGYVVMETGAGTERMRIDASGNVMIGTTTASYKFNLYESAATNLYFGITAPLANQSAITLADITNGQDIVMYRPGSTRDYRIYTPTAGDAFTIIQSGNVGIGTTAPGVSLEVNKNWNTDTMVQVVNANTGTAGRSGFYATNSGGGVFIQTLSTGYTTVGMREANYALMATDSNLAGLKLVTSGAGDPIIFGTAGVESMRIDGSGQVGIGTTTPGAKLQVSGGARSYTGGATGWVGLNIGTAGAPGYVEWYRADGITRIGYMGWSTQGATNLGISLENSANFIIGGGNVGIGENSPLTNLSVKGSSPVSMLGGQISTGSNAAYAVGNISGITFMALESSSAQTAYAAIQMVTTGDYAGRLRFATRNGSAVYDEHMTILANGNVGIGTISPSVKLQISGDLAVVKNAATAISGDGGNNGIGVSGNATGTGSGVYGEGYRGVRGYGTAYGTTGGTSATGATTAYGVLGQSTGSTFGYGVYGQGSYYGVYGLNSDTVGTNYGVYGRADGVGSDYNYGGRFFAASAINTNYGVYSYGSDIGILGESNTTNSIGVYGSVGSSDGRYGVYGNIVSASGRGVYGSATSATGSNYGVYGSSSSSLGTGVYGTATGAGAYGVDAVNSTGVAVRGSSTSYWGVLGNSSSSIGVFGQGSTGVNGQGTVYDFYASGGGTDYGTSSSIRWKRNIVQIDNALSKVLSIRGVYYDWDKEHGGKRDMGMIAEEVGKYVPEIVGWDPDAPGYATGMDYGHLTPVLVEAIKDQQKQIEPILAMISRFTIDENGTLTVKKVVTEELELGGYCVKIKDGKLEAIQGNCK